MKDLSYFLGDEVIVNEKYVNKTLYTLASDSSGKVAYKMNEHGYRSKSFKDKSKYNILTLGCSWTMGIGLEEEATWPALIADKLQGTLFNYAMYGVSTSFIAKNYYKILKTGIIPDVTLIMWPGFSRRDYITEAGEFRKIGGFRMATKEDPVWRNSEEDLLFLQLRNDNQDLMEFWEAYNFVETVSKLHNTKVFHTVAGYYYEVYKNLKPKLESTINYHTFYEPEECYQNDGEAEDRQHPGRVWHKTFTDGFYNFIKSK